MWVFGKALSRDYARFRPDSGLTICGFLRASVTNPGLQACFFLRAQQRQMKAGRTGLARLFRTAGFLATGADFLPGCEVGPGLLIHHPNGIVIGSGAVVGIDCTILQQVTLGEKHADGTGEHLYPWVGNSVVIGAGAKILGGVRLGDGARIGANAVVTMDVPPGAVAVGVPARVLSANAVIPPRP
jgi:serine O-acetyltransferase